MSKSSGFRVFLFILFVCKFFHFNAPFFADYYKKSFLLVEVPAQIISATRNNDNYSYLPEDDLSLYNILRVILTIDALAIQNESSRRFPVVSSVLLELSFELNNTEQRRFYRYNSIKAEEYKNELELTPEKSISTTVFVYPNLTNKAYLSRDEIQEANTYQIQAFFYSFFFLVIVALILFGQASHLIALKTLAFVLLFLIFSTYETKTFMYFFSSCFIYFYYRVFVILCRSLLSQG